MPEHETKPKRKPVNGRRAIRLAAFLTLASAFAAASSVLQARDITTLDGKLYKDVSIRAKPNGLEIVHSTGVAFVSFKNLPETVRKEFGYDPAKAAEYEEKLKEARKARAKAIAERSAKAAAEKKRKDAERAERERRKAARLAAIREDILLNGDLYCMTSNKLYDENGAKMIYTFTKKGTLVPGNGRYHLLKNMVHMINSNAVPVEGITRSLDAENKNLERDIAAMENSLADAAKRIDENHARIAEILSLANVSIVNCYDAQGRFIGYQYIQNVISDAQIAAIHHLDSENSALRRAMRKTNSAIEKARARRNQVAQRSAYLAAQLAAFRQNQKNYREKRGGENATKTQESTHPQRSQEKTSTPEDAELERKLAKLKEMLDKNLIPKDIYKAKVAEAIDTYLGLPKKNPPPTATERKKENTP